LRRDILLPSDLLSILLLLLLIVTPFYPFALKSGALVIFSIILLILIWYLPRTSIKIKMGFTFFVLLLIGYDAFTGSISKYVNDFLEMRSSVVYVPFEVLAIPLMPLNILPLPSFLKFILGVIVLTGFWTVILFLIHKMMKTVEAKQK